MTQKKISSITSASRDYFSIENREPILTEYEIFTFLYQIIKDKQYKKHKLNIRPSGLRLEYLWNRLKDIERKRIITRNYDFYRHIWINSNSKNSVNSTICNINPFAYISHLSAMHFYGISNRIPKNPIFTLPSRNVWNENIERVKPTRKLKFYTHLEEYEYVLKYKYYSIPEELQGVKTNIFTSNRICMNPTKSEHYTRVSNIARCFIDMVQEPELCGGIYHVVESIEANAKIFLEEIINYVEENSEIPKIAIVRLGYILEEICNIKDKRIIDWQKYGQRGGSRKLFADNKYNGQKISEKWKLSINI